jgi:AAA15 family ATPase/GTPase
MLVEFKIKNYKCFRDEQVLSLVASSDRSQPNNVTELPIRKGLRLLKSAVLYGANASGKTTLLDALHFFTHLVRSSASKEPDEKIGFTPFLLDSESGSSPSSFEATFVSGDGVLYQYGFTLDQTRVHEEWLTAYPMGRPRKLYSRYLDSEGKESFEFGSHLKGEKDKLRELTRPNALFLSVGATFNNPQLLEVYRWFSERTMGVQADRINEPVVFSLVKKNEELFDRIRRLLKYADFGILDFALTERELTLDELPKSVPVEVRNALEELVKVLPESDSRMVDIRFIHQATAGKVAFGLDDESGGTQQFFALGFFTLSALAEGKIIFIDELDTSLHPLLVQALVRLFHNPQTNPKNAQLIFNTHDTTLLSTAIFRRDQIWLVEKDVTGASCVYSLLDYSPRRDEALEKGYLQGRYGAIPFLSEPIEGVIFNA